MEDVLKAAGSPQPIPLPIDEHVDQVGVAYHRGLFQPFESGLILFQAGVDQGDRTRRYVTHASGFFDLGQKIASFAHAAGHGQCVRLQRERLGVAGGEARRFPEGLQGLVNSAELLERLCELPVADPVVRLSLQ